MCFRYVGVDLREERQAERLEELRERYREVSMHDRFPGDAGTFVREGGELVEGSWGLQPSWAKDPRFGRKNAYNARGETVAEKPTFRNAFRHRRGLLPAAAFYERAEGRWLRVSPRGEDPFLIAALWEESNDATGGLPTFTMVTTEPNEAVREANDRMPVLLSTTDAAGWTDPRADLRELHALLVPCPPDWMDVEDAGPVERKKSAKSDEPRLF